MKNIKATRAKGFIIDYAIWYGLMYVMILFYFFIVMKETPFAGNLGGYAEIFSDIMHRSSFLAFYFSALMIYEILIPLLFDGQTISKKILKVRIEPFTAKAIIIRGLLKLIFVNPCGVVSFMIGLVVFQNTASIISDVMWVLLILDIVVLIRSGKALHDYVTATNVIYIEEEKKR